MTKYTLYSLANGAIIRSGEVTGISSLLIEEQIEDIETQGLILGGFDDSAYYVVDEEAVERPSIVHLPEYELERDEEISFNVPIGTVAVIGNNTYDVDDGTLEFSSTEPIRTTIVLLPPFPWRRSVIEMVVQ